MFVSSNPTSSIVVSSAKQCPQSILYRGRTINTDTQTEIFVDGIPNRRLYMSDASGVLLHIRGVRYNNNTGGVAYTDSVALASINAAGVFSFIDTDGTTAGTQGISEKANAVVGPGGAVVVTASSLNWSTVNGFRVDSVNRSGLVPSSIRLSVYGILSNIIDWEFQIEVLEAGSRN